MPPKPIGSFSSNSQTFSGINLKGQLHEIPIDSLKEKISEYAEKIKVFRKDFEEIEALINEYKDYFDEDFFRR